MKKLILATASVLALGIASSGIGHAADPYSSPTTTQTPALCGHAAAKHTISDITGSSVGNSGQAGAATVEERGSL